MMSRKKKETGLERCSAVLIMHPETMDSLERLRSMMESPSASRDSMSFGRLISIIVGHWINSLPPEYIGNENHRVTAHYLPELIKYQKLLKADGNDLEYNAHKLLLQEKYLCQYSVHDEFLVILDPLHKKNEFYFKLGALPQDGD